MKRFASLAATILILAAPLVQAQEMRQVTDAFGQSVQVPANPQRVVTLSEIDLDSALTLGVTPVGAVNGRGQPTLPRYLLDKVGEGIPVVGDLGSPNLETLITLEPDLILTGPTTPEQLALLREIAPTVVTGQWTDGWQPLLRRVASALNREQEGEAFLQQYEARLQQARTTLAGHQGESISIVRWNPKGPSFMYPGTFASSVVESMGLVRPAQQQGKGAPHSPALSLESLNLLDADWLVIGTLSASGDAVEAMRQAEQTPAYQQLPVIREKRFGAVDGSLWTSSGGPQAALKVIADVETLLQKRG
ncbi:iron-siderophore ABC transporter substrate-binding protein [Aeromonas enteropelogenes]|uniref:ABC transporter substrate-binding protein n=1 Tax=Aeromonas enteropelogenes TaxID=29489 RepID=UPI0005A7B1D0|nr:iron-siderophore ABC transporter substrate-binding protein [Aeromonas enteropelogenes]UBH54330.1 iron-siderophore ABC transporter substrate-binding protein [Aeromonas enteropelogenes]